MARTAAYSQRIQRPRETSSASSPLPLPSLTMSHTTPDDDLSSPSDDSVDGLGPSASTPGSPSYKLHPESLEAEDSVNCLWEDCGINFIHLPSLIDHIHNDHIGVHKSNYTCEWTTCPRRGLPQTSRFALISHIRSHTGEKPFMCPLPECDKSFTRSDALAKHMRLQHNISPPAPGRGGSKKRKRTGAEDHLSRGSIPHPSGSSPAPSVTPSSGGFNTFKVEPNTPSELFEEGPHYYATQQDYFGQPPPPAMNGRHRSPSPRQSTPGQPPEDDDGYSSTSSDVLPAHLMTHFEPSTGLVLNRTPSMVMYLLMKAKHRYALDQHEQLCEELRAMKAQLKKEKEDKEVVLNTVLRATFGGDAEQLIAPIPPPPGIDISDIPASPFQSAQAGPSMYTNGNGR